MTPYDWKEQKLKPFYQPNFTCDFFEELLIGDDDFMPYKDFENELEKNPRRGIGYTF